MKLPKSKRLTINPDRSGHVALAFPAGEVERFTSESTFYFHKHTPVRSHVEKITTADPPRKRLSVNGVGNLHNIATKESVALFNTWLEKCGEDDVYWHYRIKKID